MLTWNANCLNMIIVPTCMLIDGCRRNKTQYFCQCKNEEITAVKSDIDMFMC